MELFHLPPCKEVGFLKSALKEARWNETIEPTYEAEIAFLRETAISLNILKE